MNKNISLIVLAAGLGSRYGGLKQLDGLGPNGETILEYSVFDAIEAGFTKVVFIVRDFFLEDFKSKVSNKFKDRIAVDFVNQPISIKISDIGKVEREKPWGTSHAVLVAKEHIHEPFAVINSDDYYGKQAFHEMANFLKNEASPTLYAMIGYILEKTLSVQGHVNRGVCEVDEEDFLVNVVETLKIRRKAGEIVYGEDKKGNLDADTLVSMNFWGFHQNFFHHLEAGFLAFAKENYTNPKAEYFIPLIIDDLIKAAQVKVKVIPSYDRWYGVTYKEDAVEVKQAFEDFSKQKQYPRPLWQK